MADSIREAAERLLQQLDLKRSDPDCALRLEQAERDLRAAMAAEPQGEGLSDEELNALWNCSGIADEHGNHTGDIFEFARSAIAADRARWGRPATPLALQLMRRIYINNPAQIAECDGPCTEGGPEACDCGALWRDEPALAEPQGEGPKGRPATPLADGEVGELVEWLRVYSSECSPLWAGLVRRAADLLTHLALQPVPAPVAADIRYEFSVMDSDYVEQAGGSAPTIEQARDEGLHYLAQYSQDGPHALELRRVEILSLPPRGAAMSADRPPLGEVPDPFDVVQQRITELAGDEELMIYYWPKGGGWDIKWSNEESAVMLGEAEGRISVTGATLREAVDKLATMLSTEADWAERGEHTTSEND